MKARVPQDEAARIQALRDYAILDTPQEEAFDDIATLASCVCETPIALVSLTDSDRQWFKARVGLQTTETHRDHAFCAHAILRPEEVMIVNDASRDPRFADNPLVTGEPGIRFYAGAPLVTPRGEALGTVCVIDRAPRELPADRLEALRALSRQAVAQLELRRTIAELGRAADDLRSRQREIESCRVRLDAANAALAEQCVTDGLTGVSDRRAFDTALHKELARASRDGVPLSLLLVDVDDFRTFNDEFGHEAGDQALRRVAELLAANSRPFDVVARYGGDEFALILPRAGATAALSVAERMRRTIGAAPRGGRPVTVSIGASTSGGEADGAPLIAQAERALFRAKARGRNQVVHSSR